MSCPDPLQTAEEAPILFHEGTQQNMRSPVGEAVSDVTDRQAAYEAIMAEALARPGVAEVVEMYGQAAEYSAPVCEAFPPTTFASGGNL